jgi:hypothetical protein
VEPIIALLLTIAIAGLIGFRRSAARKLSDADTRALGATYDEYLRAVSAAGLVKLSDVVGEPPAKEDVDEATNGPRLVSDMVSLLEGEHANAVIRAVRGEESPTVNTFLTDIESDVEKYWPEQVPDVHRARESLK